MTWFGHVQRKLTKVLARKKFLNAGCGPLKRGRPNRTHEGGMNRYEQVQLIQGLGRG